jgi:uncharacterized protein
VKRFVLDTNIVVSAILWGGTPRLVLAKIIEMGILILNSDDLLRELERTLSKPKFDDHLRLIAKTGAQITSDYSHLTTLVVPSTIPTGVIRDTKDEIILAVGVGGKADAIISGDKDLIDLKQYKGVQILTPRQ